MQRHPRSACRAVGLVALAVLVVAPALMRAGEPFDYFRNSWNVLGLRDYEHGTRVTPDNKLLLAEGDEVRLRFGEELTALSRKQVKTLMDGWLPIVLITAEDGPVRYEFTLWATPLPTVKDWRQAFDGPTEGEDFLNWILVKVTNTGSQTARPRFQAETKGPSRHTDMEHSWSCRRARVRKSPSGFRLPRRRSRS